jgi:hypothetical protein
MDEVVQFFTDAATLVAFDPQQLQQRIDDEPDWWCGDAGSLPEVNSGDIAIIGLDGDGVYIARVTTGSLRQDEQDYADASVGPLGVRVRSGSIYLGAGEALPGGGNADVPDAGESRGRFLPLPPGDYELTVYAIAWRSSASWLKERGCAGRGERPADLIVLIRERSASYAPPRRFRLIGSGEFLFPSDTRVAGPQVGMLVETTVRRSPRGLCLKPCGPGAYDAALVDYTGVAWRDRIILRVTSVDHERRELLGELVEKLPA